MRSFDDLQKMYDQFQVHHVRCCMNEMYPPVVLTPAGALQQHLGMS